jgi:hypothetical protein
MDTSEKYILMCRKAYRFLGPRKPEAWDYWLFEDARNSLSGERVMVVSAYETDSGVYGPGLDLKADGTEYPGERNMWPKICPIWQQDQLQAMVISQSREEPWIIAMRLVNYISYQAPLVESEKRQWSLEQWWLAFVMKEKYKRTWGGNDWVSEGKNA